MADSILTLLVGDPEKATHIIASSRTSATTPTGKLLYPAFVILNDEPMLHGEIKRITVKSEGLTTEEETLVMRSLTEYCGNTGASARKFFQQKLCSATEVEK